MDSGYNVKVINKNSLEAAKLSANSNITHTNNTYQHVLELKHDYQKYLESIGLSHTKEEFKKLNVIDMREDLKTPIEDTINVCKLKHGDNSKAYNAKCLPPSFYISPEFAKKIEEMQLNQSFFYEIPCFEKGAIRINDKCYIAFKIKEMDIDNRSCDIDLWLYEQNYLEGGFALKLKTNISIQDNPILTGIDGIAYGYDAERGYSIGKIKDLISIPYFSKIWSKSDIKLWNEVVIPAYYNAENSNREVLKQFEYNFEKIKTSPEEFETIQIFQYAIWKVNILLEKETLSRAKKVVKKRANTATRKEDDSLVIVPSDKRKIRVLGNSGITITSERKPRTPDATYVKHYSVSSWTQVGHIRHLKSGKTTYIRPQVKHRHALMDKNIETLAPNKTIKVTS